MLLLVALASALCAQGQANQGNAALGVGGLPVNTAAIWPLPLDVPLGGPTTLDVVGSANVNFRLAAQARLLDPGTPVLGGQMLHVDPLTALDLFAAFPGFAVTDSSGGFSLPLTPAGFPLGSPLGLQAALFDPSAGPGISLSGAIQVSFTQGVSSRQLPLGLNTSQEVDFASEGLRSFPFYEQSDSSIFVNSSGNLTFQAGSVDFTPTPNEFHAMQPRIAPWWVNLDPTTAGSTGGVILTVDPNGGASGAGSLNVRWDNVPIFGGASYRHSFEVELDFSDGGIRFSHDARNSAGLLVALTGITPGRGFRAPGVQPFTAGPASDFTAFTLAAPQVGAPRESFWEAYGLPGTLNWSLLPSLGNAYDLSGRAVVSQPLGVGAPNGFYLAYTL